MCGIFGLIASSQKKIPVATLEKLARKLFELSETRGKDASGIVAVTDDQVLVYKDAQRASLMLRTHAFAEVLGYAKSSYLANKPFVLAGHTRMATNGSEESESNNQPVIREDVVLLHNGIIVNDVSLWQAHPLYVRQCQVDTEIFAALLAGEMKEGGTFIEAMRIALAKIKGANTIAAIHADQGCMVLGTTNGSLYFWSLPAIGLSLFGSEEFILSQAVQVVDQYFSKSLAVITQLAPNDLLTISLKSGITQVLAKGSQVRDSVQSEKGVGRRISQLHADRQTRNERVLPVANRIAEIERLMRVDQQAIAALRRCTKCLLPETFPFIEFDELGVCQFCRNHRPIQLRGPEALHQLADQVKRNIGKRNCLVPISGGRDSCYGLHYVKRELGLNPVAYTYDWGFVTDLARRNISRICGELNVEHVLVAADIKKKRENVLKNVTAWLAKPTLSMIPLFMAGDKAFFYYASIIQKQMKLGPILFSMNWLEKTGFKTGFAGINDTTTHDKTYGLTRMNQLKLISHYGYNFLSNPKYINGSIPDTLFGFLSYYLLAKDYYSIFDFLSWNQAEIESVIVGDYDWESSPDTKSTWRIGDGTAPFYNYIYLTMAGFSENDTFRSNQIREGMLDREVALQSVYEENAPRAESFKWYCDTIGLDAVAALKAINGAKRYYAAN